MAGLIGYHRLYAGCFSLYNSLYKRKASESNDTDFTGAGTPAPIFCPDPVYVFHVNAKTTKFKFKISLDKRL
jgi:hypothetical protein